MSSTKLPLCKPSEPPLTPCPAGVPEGDLSVRLKPPGRQAGGTGALGGFGGVRFYVR